MEVGNRQQADQYSSISGTKKALDIITLKIICLSKLNDAGVRDRSGLWFESYLSHRKQYVVLNGFQSEIPPIDYGVPQGSILSPTLCSIHYNDIVKTINNGSITVFADDTVNPGHSSHSNS